MLTRDGCASCEEAFDGYFEEVGSLRGEVAGCSVDTDCTCADTISACGTDCQAPIASSQLSYYESQLEALGRRFCGSPRFDDTCDAGSASCMTCEAACVSGKCANVAVP